MLCERCKVIALNDQLPGLQETTLDDGLDYSGEALELEYDRWDSFPDFPDLQASARGGCGFFRLLRATLRERLADLWKTCAVYRRIHITNLEYQWDREHYQDVPGTHSFQRA